MKKIVLLLIVWALCAQAEYVRDNLLERDERATDFILQLSTRYAIPVPTYLFQEPFPTQEVVTFLHKTDSLTTLTAAEKEEVRLLLGWYEGKKRIFGKEGEKGSILLNADLYGATALSYTDSVAFGWKGVITPKIQGHFGPLSMYTGISIFTEQRLDTMWEQSSYEPIDGNPYNLFGRDDSANIRTSDQFRAGASWMANIIRFDFAVDNFSSGPAKFNPLLINTKAMPIGYLRMTLDFDWLTYTQTVGLLSEMRNYSKYFHYHRIEVPLFERKFTMGFNGMVVYGSTADSTTTAEFLHDPLQSKYYELDRSLNPIYMIPFLPYAFAEHYSGDRDNAMLSFDLSLRLPRTFNWYFEFLLDDFSNPLTIFSDDFGNKWGLTVGGTWYGQLGEKNFNVTAEYTRVEPWVYTHFRGVNHTSTHYGEVLGAELGPNSAQINGLIEYQFNQKNSLKAFYTNSRYNRSYRGGDVRDVYVTIDHSLEDTTLTADSETKAFLEGPVMMDQRVGITWCFLPYHLYEMESTVFYDTFRGVGLALSGGFEF